MLVIHAQNHADPGLVASVEVPGSLEDSPARLVLMISDLVRLAGGESVRFRDRVGIVKAALPVDPTAAPWRSVTTRERIDTPTVSVWIDHN